MKRFRALAVPGVFAASLLAGSLAPAGPAAAFCGFYVAKADAKLFNKASKVVVARRGDRTVVTMASDYEGDPRDFALVVPVPSIVTREQINVTQNALIDHLDAYSAPRLVEYHDPDPCAPPVPQAVASIAFQEVVPSPSAQVRRGAEALGVTIEASYTVGEYDILILSATQSDGLAIWLDQEGYRVPPGAGPVLSSYIKQEMKFFVAKVNLAEQARRGASYLRPIQVAYETPRFMLPIRLGTVNASGPQDMIMLMLTERGRVETTNYRTVRIPSDLEIPIFTRGDFGEVYKAMFDRLVEDDGMRHVYLEYAWNMGWCDPCAADPLPTDKLVELGAFWLLDGAGTAPAQPGFGGQPQNAYVTRLHVRYDAERFPEDLKFQETADTGNFQGRYVLRHPFTGPAQCEAGEAYRRELLPARFAEEAATLARLTGWDVSSIRTRMAASGQAFDEPTGEAGKAWYQRMWRKN